MTWNVCAYTRDSNTRPTYRRLSPDETFPLPEAVDLAKPYGSNIGADLVLSTHGHADTLTGLRVLVPSKVTPAGTYTLYRGNLLERTRRRLVVAALWESEVGFLAVAVHRANPRGRAVAVSARTFLDAAIREAAQHYPVA